MKKDGNLMRMNLQFFADGDAGASGEVIDTLDGLDALLDGTPAEGEQANDAGTGSAPAGEEQQQQQQQQQQQNTQPSEFEKQQFAFAEMRRTNATLTQLLGKIAQVNGIEYTNNTDLLNKLNDSTIEQMAKRQNVPVELLKEIESLRRDSDAFKAQQAQSSAIKGFQDVMTTYGLSNEELQGFAKELDAKGVNPFTQPIDLVAEYKLAHFDEIVAKQIDRAVKEALSKSGSADNNSSTPNRQQSAGSGEQKPISTLEGLNSFLDSMGR